MQQKQKKESAALEELRAPIPVVEADPAEGLSKDQVVERQKGGWCNLPVKSPTKTEREIIAGHVFTYFNLIFVVLAALLLVVGSYRDATFIFIAAVNTIIGIVQEIRSKRTIDKLTVLAAPRGTVVRAGAEMSVPTDHMVRDDIAVFASSVRARYRSTRP